MGLGILFSMVFIFALLDFIEFPVYIMIFLLLFPLGIEYIKHRDKYLGYAYITLSVLSFFMIIKKFLDIS